MSLYQEGDIVQIKPCSEQQGLFGLSEELEKFCECFNNELIVSKVFPETENRPTNYHMLEDIYGYWVFDDSMIKGKKGQVKIISRTEIDWGE